MELVKTSDTSDLDYFLDFLFEGLEGYAYLVLQEPGNKESWNSQMYQWPEQRELLKHYIIVGFEKFEVYLAPVLYTDTSNAQRPNVKVSNVVWTEFDGNTPEDWGDYPPSLIIQSSEKGHEHVYWRLNRPLWGPDEIENFTQRITYNFSADSSAWDATQVLRPPGTFNHKRSLGTSIQSVSENIYDHSVFDVLAPAPVVEQKYGNLVNFPPYTQLYLSTHLRSRWLNSLSEKVLKKVSDRPRSWSLLTLRANWE